MEQAHYLVNVDLSNYHYARHFKYLRAKEILIPTQCLADTFDRMVTPIFTKVQQCRDTIRMVEETRDRLLPKLMSDELEV